MCCLLLFVLVTMNVSSLLNTKSLLLFSNLVLLISGMFVVTIGFLVLCDWPRVLLSRLVIPLAGTNKLPQPLLYYIALILLGIGLIICSAAILGCWSACAFNYCILTVTFLLIFMLFLTHCTIYGMLWLWPDCLGLNVSPIVMSRTLQRSYGKPGFEQYTAAMDLAQVQFHCCGMSTSIEYDTSLWRLESSAPSLAVPLTCCVLSNHEDEDAYVNPRPLSQNKCQTLELEHHNGFRHLQGCIARIESWFDTQYRSFLITSTVILIIEFLVLLAILLACTKTSNPGNGPFFPHPDGTGENIYENEERRPYMKNIYTVNRAKGYRVNS